MNRTLIVPGFKGSQAGHWQHHWLQEDPDAILVRQDNWFEPCLESWLARLISYVETYPGSTIVAHSLGVPLVVHAALRAPDLPVARALFVAPADVDRRMSEHACFRSFVPVPLARLPFPAMVAASRDDPFVDYQRAAGFAVAWGAAFIDMGHAGHVNVESGYGHWPEASDLLPPLLDGPRSLWPAAEPASVARPERTANP